MGGTGDSEGGGRGTLRLGQQGGPRLVPTGPAWLCLPRQGLQSPSSEVSQDVSVPGGVPGPWKASARV